MNLTAEQLRDLVGDLLRERSFWDVRATLRDVAPADVADTLSLLTPEQAALAFRLLPRDHAGEAFAELEPDRQERLIEELGATAAQTWMIGDSPVDVRTARAAGVRVAGVTWGLAPDALRQEGPDHLIDDPRELVALADK